MMAKRGQITPCSEDHLKEFVARTKSLLESIGGTEALEKELGYYKPSGLRPQFPTMNHIHVRLSDSIRNTGRMRLVITDDRSKAIASQLLSCSLESICGGGVDLVTRMIETGCQLSGDEQSEKRSWGTFKQGVVDAACYLNRFGSSKEFYRYVDSNGETVDGAWDLALELDRIKGIGPALACDFLKEIGVDRYGKPDVHIKRTFGRLRLIGKVNENKEAFKVLWDMGRVSGCSPAVVDKVLWMAASGRWDRTLDKDLGKREQREEQLDRKRRFSGLLDEFVRDS